MLQRMQDKIAQALHKRSITQSDEITQYVILYVALIFCLVVHVYLLALYTAFSQPYFIPFNLMSVLMYIGLLIVHRTLRKYTATAVLLSLQVALYAALTAYLIGIDTYVLGYFVLVFVLQVILPYGTPGLRAGVFSVSLALMALSVVFHFTVVPPVAVEAPLSSILLISNVCVLAFGTMVELLMGNVVKRIADASSDIRVQELTSMANTDPLTGLYNRRYAEEYLADLLTHRQNIDYCVAMLDIDDFKQVNDSLGHAAGDEVLVHLARMLTDTLRKTDIVFRWGGEELLIVLENITLPQAHIILDKLRLQLARSPVATAAGLVNITVTIGVAALDLRHPAKSIERCDARMYAGKRSGKNKAVSG